MTGDIEAKHGVFACQAFYFAPRLGFVQSKGYLRRNCSRTEKPVLPRFPDPRGALHGRQRVIDGCQHGLAWSERIQCAGLDEAFKHALVEESRLDALAQII